jgi:hypothetical protein
LLQFSFWNADGKPISAEEFLNNLLGELPNLFKDEDDEEEEEEEDLERAGTALTSSSLLVPSCSSNSRISIFCHKYNLREIIPFISYSSEIDSNITVNKRGIILSKS